MTQIKDTKYNSHVDNIILKEAQQLRYDIANIKIMLATAEEKLSGLEPDEIEIKTIRVNANEERKRIEEAESLEGGEEANNETPEIPIEASPDQGTEDSGTYEPIVGGK